MPLRYRAATLLPARQLTSLGNTAGPKTFPAGEDLPAAREIKQRTFFKGYEESRTVRDNLEEKYVIEKVM